LFRWRISLLATGRVEASDDTRLIPYGTFTASSFFLFFGLITFLFLGI
jgi:hypothetical protein